MGEGKYMNKKLISLLLVFCMALSILSAEDLKVLAADSASGTCGNSVTWLLSDGTLTISGTGAMADVSPEYVPWKLYNDVITTVNIEYGVTKIGSAAFKNCKNITNVTIPDSVINIGRYAFCGCSGLKNITIPDSVTNLDYGVFIDCTGFTDVTIPETTTGIGDDLFCGCSGLKNISIPAGMTSIQDGMYKDCTGLTSISIPDSVTDIGYYAFSGCSSFTCVTVPDKVKNIGYHAFAGCSALKDIVIPDSLTSVGDGAFSDCSSLQNVYFKGIESQWSAIKIGLYNTPLTSAAVFSRAAASEQTSVLYGTGKSQAYGAQVIDYSSENNDVYYYSKAFYDACNEYMEAVKGQASKVKKDSRYVIKNAAAQYQSEDENSGSGQSLLSFESISASSSELKRIKDTAYTSYAQLMQKYTDTAVNLGKIDLSKHEIVISAKLVNKINSYLKGVDETFSCNGYKVNIVTAGWGAAMTGRIIISKGLASYVVVLCTTPDKTAAAMQEYVNQLVEIEDDLLYQALQSITTELADVTGFSQLSQSEIESLLKDKTVVLKKDGYGDILKDFKKCYRGYEIIRKVISFENKDSISEALKDADGMYKALSLLDYSDEAITNEAVKQAVSQLKSAQNNLEESLYYYLYDTTGTVKKPNLWEKACNSVYWLFQCPVDFTVYDENGQVLGSVKDGQVSFDDSIYIEMHGDIKELFVPDGMKVKLVIEGTDEGQFNLMMEDMVNGEPTGRVNYYDIPVSDGSQYVQTVDTGSRITDINTAPLIADSGNISASEYLPADNMQEHVSVQAVCSQGGTVSGAAKYAKGDSVHLDAYPDDSAYRFKGWYNGSTLITTTSSYRFTAVQDVLLYAVFEKVKPHDTDYQIDMSPEYDENADVQVYDNDDSTKEIVFTSFQNDPPQTWNVSYTGYDAAGSQIGETKEASLSYGADRRYRLDSLILTKMVKVVLKDADGNIIATLSDEREASEPAITANPSGASYLAGDSAAVLSVEANASDEGTITYQWYSSDTDSITEGKAISGATDAGYVPSTAVPGIVYYYCTVSDTLDNGRTASSVTKTAAIHVTVLQFQDVPSNAWFYDSVKYVYSKVIMTGLTEDTFAPGDDIGRGQFATILHRLEGSPDIDYSTKFPDVPDLRFYTKPVLWANSVGIVTGYGNGLFGPAEKITREQIAVMLYRYAAYKNYDVGGAVELTDYPDAGSVSAFAVNQVKWAVGIGLIKGDKGNINPHGSAKRAECATIIMRFLDHYNK